MSKEKHHHHEEHKHEEHEKVQNAVAQENEKKENAEVQEEKTLSAEEKISEFEKQIDGLKKENADLKDQVLRRAADFDNYRKRAIQEKQEAFDFANTNLLKDLLESLDNFDRTVEAAATATDPKSIADGVTMINKLIPALQRVASVSEKEIKEILEKPVNESSWIESEKKSSGSIEKNDFESGANSRRNNSYAEKKIAKNENQTYGAKNHPQKKKDSADEIQSKISAGKNSSSNSKSEKKVIVENTAAGIRLTMQNLNFKPDSAELLPGENERLDQITQVLKEVPDQMFLVEGHTASVGYEKGEMKLSVERANSVANALIQRGIPREKFICKGSGGLWNCWVR